jgi:ferredoxin
MNSSILRKIRIALSLLFFLVTTFLLIDIYETLPVSFSNKILFLQFVPSLLKSIAFISISAFGFIVVLVITVLFGRIYCSSICPLGVLQDIANWSALKLKPKKKRKFNFLKEQKMLRLVLLAIPIVIFILGSSFTVNLLDPYSVYGRFAGNFFRPALVLINNVISSILVQFKVYGVYSYELKAFHVFPFIIALVFMLLIMVMVWLKGRLYCNTVCPVGTLLGYISKFSFFKIIIKEEDCIGCGSCAKECKASCIDSKNKFIDTSRCVTCFDCLSSCPTDGITYSYSLKKKSKPTAAVDESKRNFLSSTALYFLSLSTITAQAVKKIEVTKPSTVAILRKNPISPPGSISIERFNSKCTACHLCVSACPTQVLQPSFLEYGFLGMLQPRMENITGFCNFECTICSQVCPTGAIMPIELEKKKLTQIGKAHFIKDNCIVNTQKTDCGACSEHCPTKAVHMVPFEQNLVIPEVREEYCIGCGACEFACPTKPYKSIYVEGNTFHQAAKKNVEEKHVEEKQPEVKKQEKKEKKVQEDFPF